MIIVAVLSIDSREFHWRLLRAEEIVKTITNPLRGSTLCVHCYHQTARPCKQGHLHGVSHEAASPMPTPLLTQIGH